MDERRLTNPPRATLAEYDKNDPFQSPQWRYERVLRSLSKGNKLSRRDDNLTKTAKAFIGAWGRDHTGHVRDRLKLENMGLAFAYQFWLNQEEKPELNIIMESRTLSRQSVSEIAAGTPCTPESVAWYEALFFNVRPRMRCVDWIMREVLLPAADKIGQHYRFQQVTEDEAQTQAVKDSLIRKVPVFVQPHLDFTLPYFAYFGGPIVCEFMITGFQNGKSAQTVDELGMFLDEVFANHVRRRSAQVAQVIDVNRYTAMELMTTHVQLMQLQKEMAMAGAGGGERRMAMEKLMRRMLDGLPWTSGMESSEVFEGTVMAKYDDSAIELSSQELMILSGEDRIDIDDELLNLAKSMEERR